MNATPVACLGGVSTGAVQLTLHNRWVLQSPRLELPEANPQAGRARRAKDGDSPGNSSIENTGSAWAQLRQISEISNISDFQVESNPPDSGEGVAPMPTTLYSNSANRQRRWPWRLGTARLRAHD